MVKFFHIAAILLLCLLPCLAQNKQTRSIQELQLLLNKSGRDTNRVRLLLELGSHYAERSGALKTNSDSALYYANLASQLSFSVNSEKWLGKSWVLYSVIYRKKNDVVQGKSYVQKAIEVFKKRSDKTELGHAYLESASYYNSSVEKELAEKMKLTQLAVQLFDQAGQWEAKANSLIVVGNLYDRKSDHDSAMSRFRQALTIYRKIHYKDTELVYVRMTSVSYDMGKLEDAQKYGIVALKIAESRSDSSSEMAVIYNELAVIYLGMGIKPEAIQYFQKALVYAEKNNDTARTANLIQGLVGVYSLRGEPEAALDILKSMEKKYTFSRPSDRAKILSCFLNCYVTMKDFNSAKPYLNELISISKKYPPTNEMQTETFRYITSYYLATKDYKNAERYCAYNEIFWKKERSPYQLALNYRKWFQADTGLRNFAAALSHYRMFSIIKDSLFQDSYTQNIAKEQTRFETEKKEKDIQLLTQKTELQQTQLKQTQLTRNVILGGSIMLILLLGLGYNRYRLKQRSNKQLEAQKREINKKNESLNQLLDEKEWLIKEIHHRVKNNLQIIMSLLNTQSQYLDDKAAIKAISESRNRMQAMSLIHQRLYQTENVSTVNMLTYISELTSYIRDSYDTNSHIRFAQEIDDINLDVSQAIPVGLILNEAITNSVKYAFPDNRPGTINIVMKNNTANTIRLQITDDGIGLPVVYSIDSSSSLGMSLMKGLTKQLGGTFIMKNNKGLEIEIEFPYIHGLHVV